MIRYYRSMMKNYVRKILWTVCLLLQTVFLSAQTACPIVFAHRGGRAEQDENTLAAFRNAWQAGMHGFETDVRMTKDGAFVISHDASFKRMCGVDGEVEEMTADEIRRLKTLKGNPVLFLDELLDFFSDKPGLYVEFEMKTTDTKAYPADVVNVYCEKLLKAIKAKMPGDALWYMTSFDYRPLRYFRERHPETNLLMISSAPCNDQTIEAAKALGVKTIGVTLDGTTRAAVDKAHKAGLTVSLWPGSKVNDTLLALWLGADRACTDIPIQVKHFFEDKLPWVEVRF